MPSKEQSSSELTVNMCFVHLHTIFPMKGFEKVVFYRNVTELWIIKLTGIAHWNEIEAIMISAFKHNNVQSVTQVSARSKDNKSVR